MSTPAKSVKLAPEFDIKDAPAWYPSLCIPRVFSNITWKRVKAVLEKDNWGKIAKVDMVKKTNAKGETFNRVFIHFEKWSNTEEATKIREHLNKGSSVQVYYENDDTKPWYWKVSKSKIARPEPRPKKTPHPKKQPRTKVVLDQSAELDAMRKMIAQQQEMIETLKQYIPAQTSSGTVKPVTLDVPPITIPVTSTPVAQTSPTMSPPDSPPFQPPIPVNKAAVQFDDSDSDDE
jgi:hypothetical protein